MGRIPYRKPPKKVVASAALIALLGGGAAYLSLDTVADFEGYVPEGYRDPVGIPTKCWGDTRDVVVGQEYSFDECSRALNEHLYENARPVTICVKDFDQLPDKTKAALVSMAYNIGPTAFCKSSVARYFNQGRTERGCERIAEIYKTARGQALPGLERRRNYESAMCLRGLKEGK